MAVYNVQWTAGTHSKFTILKVCKTFTCGSIPQLLYKAVINKTGALTAMNYVLDIKNEKNITHESTDTTIAKVLYFDLSNVARIYFIMK